MCTQSCINSHLLKKIIVFDVWLVKTNDSLTGAMCEKGYHLTINNAHKNGYTLKTSYISTIKDYTSFHTLLDNN